MPDHKQWIKSTLHYLVKWATWPSEYNSYEPASYLIGALRAIANYGRTLKRKRKEARAAGQDFYRFRQSASAS